jgi:hypothetical protein
MPVSLIAFGRSFATRERADEVAREVYREGAGSVVLDLRGTYCSTSFLLGIIGHQARADRQIVFLAPSEVAEKLERLIANLNLTGVLVEADTVSV